MRVLKLKRFLLVHRSLLLLLFSFKWPPKKNKIFFHSQGQKKPHTCGSHLRALFFNNNNNNNNNNGVYYTHTHTHTTRSFSLPRKRNDDENDDNKRRSVLFLHSLLFHFEVYVFGAENDASRSGDRVRTKRFFSSLFVLRSETLTDAVFVWLLFCCFI